MRRKKISIQIEIFRISGIFSSPLRKQRTRSIDCYREIILQTSADKISVNYADLRFIPEKYDRQSSIELREQIFSGLLV